MVSHDCHGSYDIETTTAAANAHDDDDDDDEEEEEEEEEEEDEHHDNEEHVMMLMLCKGCTSCPNTCRMSSYHIIYHIILSYIFVIQLFCTILGRHHSRQQRQK